jgi:hypothetical protein
MTSPLTPVRAVYGAALVLSPSVPLRLATGRAPDRRTIAVVRVLGLRQVAQAALAAVSAARPAAARRAATVGAAVDAVHAASMLALAAWAPARRREALVDAGLAGAFAVAGARRAQRQAA